MCWAWFAAFSLVFLASMNVALAGGGGGAAAVDPAAPIEMLKTARTKAGASSLNLTSVQTGAGNFSSLTLVIMGLVGLVAAGFSAWQLYNNINQGEQARGSNMTYGIAFIAGSALTVYAVFVGVVTNFISA